MSARSPAPLAIAILGMSLAILSYGMKDQNIAAVVYGSGLLSAGLSLLHWFRTPKPGRR